MLKPWKMERSSVSLCGMELFDDAGRAEVKAASAVAPTQMIVVNFISDEC